MTFGSFRIIELIAKISIEKMITVHITIAQRVNLMNYRLLNQTRLNRFKISTRTEAQEN
jgi:hypothetical protein